jgi:anti-anti-sigma regulatory factor
MASPQPGLWVAATDKTAYLKVRGRAAFNLSVDLKRFLHGTLDRGYRDFVFDVSECLIMDSTFLGVMAGFGQRAQTITEPGPATLTLLNASPRILDLLENLGVAQLFRTLDSAQTAPASYMPAQTSDADKLEIARTCLEAHEVLMGINEANASKFKDVTRFFAEDIERLKAQDSSPPA